MWTTLAIWLVATLLLAFFAPSAKDYQVSSIQSLPDEAQSIIANEKVDHYFSEQDGTPGILVFQADQDDLTFEGLVSFFEKLEAEEIDGLEQTIPLSSLPPQAAMGFFSEDQSTAVIPISFDSNLETKELKDRVEQIQKLAKEFDDFSLYVTGPAGIAVDTLNLFSRADIVLLLSTVGIILFY